MDRLADMTGALASGKVTSRALVEERLARIRTLDAQLHAFLHVDEERSLAQADASDARRAQGQALGVLDGIPVALKDNIAAEGEPCTAGSKILEGWRAPYDATAVRKLREAGAVVVGRTNCDEFGMGSSTENSAFVRTHNPWNLRRVPGGSSGGAAAAVAAGLVPLALGSDTGGSIRQPASFCGVVGLKPTWSRVSRFGLVAFASSLDVIGPLASDVAGAAAVLDVIAGHDARDATSSTRSLSALSSLSAAAAKGDVKGRVIGVPHALLGAGLGADVGRAMHATIAALTKAGARVVDVELPHAKYAIAAYYVLCTAEASSNLARFDGVRYGPRRGGERGIGSVYSETRALFGHEVKRRVVLGSWVLSAGYYDAYTLKAQKVRRLVARDFDDAFSTCDALLMPTAPEPAWEFGGKSDPLSMYLADAYTVPASLAGLPAISLPAALSSDDMPIGVQLVGKAFDEESLVGIAAGLERALNFNGKPGVHA